MGIDISYKLQMKGIFLDDIAKEQEKAIQEALKGLAMSTYDDIVTMAQDSLYTSRQDYIKSLDFERAGNKLFVISIKEPGINYEEGWKSFDEKPGLLNGPKARVTKDGHRYNIIPFQHRPSSKVRHPRLAQTGYYDQLRQTVSQMEKVTPREIRDRSGRVVGSVVAKARKGIEGYTAGMVKIEKQYNERRQYTYMTFRGVSDNSSPDSWIHPGYKGLKAFDVAEKMVEDRIDQIISVIFGV